MLVKIRMIGEIRGQDNNTRVILQTRIYRIQRIKNTSKIRKISEIRGQNNNTCALLQTRIDRI